MPQRISYACTHAKKGETAITHGKCSMIECVCPCHGENK